MRIRYSLLALTAAILALAAAARGDSVPMGQVAKELSTESFLPLAGGVAQDLAKNLLYAQSQATWGGMVSLNYSIESVIKTIGLYVYVGGPTTITSESAEPGVWIQSRIAINPDATVSLTPSALDFGEVAVATPEPEVLTLMLLGLAGSMIWANLLSSKMRTNWPKVDLD